MSAISDALAKLGVNVDAPAVTNFESDPNFQIWAPSVAKAANDNGVDPTVALSLVGQESSWNPQALSPTGAYGLTQSLPSTAQNPGFGVQPWSIFLPQNNINGGISYLKGLLNNNGGNYSAALTAYNGNSTPGYASDILSNAQAEPSADQIVNGGFDTSSAPPGGIMGTNVTGTGGVFDKFGAWVKDKAIVLTVVMIAVVLIVAGTTSILQPTAAKALKYVK